MEFYHEIEVVKPKNNSVKKAEKKTEQVRDDILKGKVVYYDYIKNIQEFLTNPTMDFLNTEELQKEKEIITKNDNSPKVIKLETQEGTFEYEDGMLREGGALPIYLEFIEFAGNSLKIKEFLNKSNIGTNGYIESAIVFSHASIPITIWVKQQNNENIFITISANYKEHERYIYNGNERYIYNENEEYFYKGYTQVDFLKKFGVKKATLKIKGKIVETKGIVEIYDTYSLMPLLPILENFTDKIEWNESKTEAIIKYNDNIYKYIPKKLNLFKIINNKEVSPCLMPICGGYSVIYFDGNDVILDSKYLSSILEEFNITYSIDDENAILSFDRN